MPASNQDLRIALKPLQDSMNHFLGSSAAYSVPDPKIADELRRMLIEFRKELKRVNEVSKDRLNDARQVLNVDSEPKAPCVVKPDTNGLRVERNKAFDRLRDFSREAHDLIICDPYFFGGKATGASTYVEELVRASRMKAAPLSKLRVIYDDANGRTKTLMDSFKAACSKHSISYTCQSTSLIHDRFWIKNRNSGIVVGTSLGGLGNKLCLITEILPTDIIELLSFMKDQKLLS
jgi:hypothetical protein